MSSGLLALLDDVAALAKVAAASLDDVAAHAAKAGSKAAGIVIDDAAVTPRFVVGFAASRELPIIWKIAVGSLRNKLLFLLPAALLLSVVAPWAITPLLMLGGIYLCFEGFEKLWHAIIPHHEPDHHAMAGPTPGPATDAATEDKMVAGAIQTDFILSAEIMAITLATIPTLGFAMQAVVLGVVGIAVTAGVYGAVALIVKADDLGLALAQTERPASGFASVLRGRPAGGSPNRLDRMLSPVTQPFGRLLVRVVPVFLRALSVVGTAAMLWVGGGILVHGLEQLGYGDIARLSHDLAYVVGNALGTTAAGVRPALEWLVEATFAGLVGVIVGAVAALMLAGFTRVRAAVAPAT